jgi:4-hydroxy-tetrahydrodipicolinate synthase
MIELLFADGNPAGVKSVMTAMNLCHNYLRLPLVTVNRHIQLRIAKVMEELSKGS